MAADLHAAAATADTGAVALVVHPHPAMGGDRHHPLVVAVAEGLAAAGVTTLRPDLTDPDPVRSAAALVELAGDLAQDAGSGAAAADRVGEVLLVGYSWGAVVAGLAAPPGLVARVLVAPPVSMLDVRLPDDGLPLLVLVPAHDRFGPPDAVRALLDGRPSTTVEAVEGCDHFLVGAVGRIAARTVAWLTS